MKAKFSFLSLLLLLTFVTSAFAQQLQKLPLDPKVIKGQLDNGLTYYIRKNAEPANRAEFFIAQKVGSILEDTTQLGLAHFLEHMAFNGSTNFPGKGMINYLETIGVKFGENLNAYTSMDETVYNISNVPTVRQGIIDSCLLILHDWSAGIALEDAEIDNERGVITEEWRTRNNAGSRIFIAQLKDIYPGSQYANRFPIGDINIIKTFPYQTIRDYYKKWYRPDLQAILIVGDIDPVYVEGQIKKIFADIPAPVNPAARVQYNVPDNQEPIVSIRTDKEAKNTTARVFYKHNIIPEALQGTPAELINGYANYVLSTMINARLQEISQKPNSPFLGAGISYGSFFASPTKDALTMGAMTKEGEALKGIQGVITEVERAKRYGFTASEYERAKASFLKAVESSYKEKDKQKNNTIVRELVRNFTENEAAPGSEFEYTFYNQVVPMLPLDQINMLFAQYATADSNIIITIDGPEKEGLVYPTKDEVLTAFDAARKAEVEAYKETVSNEPLVAKLPKTGSIKKTETDGLGNTVWTLSNGVKVTFKPTDFKEDEILMNAKSVGGNSLLPDADIKNFIAFNEIINLGGVGSYSATDLQKVLAGKRAGVSVKLNGRNETMSGYCSPQDFEEMMQLTYLWFTAPRMDQDAFDSFKERTMVILNNQAKDPMKAFSDSLRQTMYGHNPRVTSLTPELLEQADYARIMEIYKDRFKDANNFAFTFVGNINLDSVKPYVLQYLGSLPTVKRKEAAKDLGIYPKKGMIQNHFNQKMENVKAVCYSVFTGDCPYTLENQIRMNILSQILSIVYTEEIREKEGGTYGVGVQGDLSKEPKQTFDMYIYFDTNPEQADKLISIVYRELNDMVKEGPKAEMFDKVQKFMLKKYDETLRENRYWMGAIEMMNESKINAPATYKSIVEKMTPADIQAFAKMIFDQNNRTEIIMKGVTE
ncbi:MAG: M16 family metallopeptidase [Bacteroidales bacterium]